MALKSKQLQSWFFQHIKDSGTPYGLDKNQAAIVLDTHQNTIVTARAGSGKTRTIVAKIIFLIAHEKIKPEEIIVFAFNKKARTEINERLAKITFDEQPIFASTPSIATTFHAFAYKTLGGKPVIGNNIITEPHEDRLLKVILQKLTDKIPDEKEISLVKQFITRAEQQFFQDYHKLETKIQTLEDSETAALLAHALTIYHRYLKKHKLINFNQMVADASKSLASAYAYKYIFVDEYQDFSLLFLTLIKELIKHCKSPHLLVVGDDWQAINRFAGSNVEYFIHFEKYFTEDCKKLFIPTNYRSGKLIVKNANFFMDKALNDPAGCQSKNKIKSHIFLCDISKTPFDYCKHKELVKKLTIKDDISPPLMLCQYLRVVLEVIKRHPGKTIKLLHRNNDFSFHGYTLELFTNIVKSLIKNPELISSSTVHRSKGLESDIVVLFEIDTEKFPSKPKGNELFSIFGDNTEVQLADEHRLFYVALTRPKEALYILTKSAKNTTQKYNFLNYLDDNFLTDFTLPT